MCAWKQAVGIFQSTIPVKTNHGSWAGEIWRRNLVLPALHEADVQAYLLVPCEWCRRQCLCAISLSSRWLISCDGRWQARSVIDWSHASSPSCSPPRLFPFMAAFCSSCPPRLEFIFDFWHVGFSFFKAVPQGQRTGIISLTESHFCYLSHCSCYCFPSFEHSIFFSI